MAFSAEHRTYNNTLHNNLYYIQTCAGKNPNREKYSAGNLGRIHGSCSAKPILRRLHDWKVFALIS